jgi:hypothetical protein
MSTDPEPEIPQRIQNIINNSPFSEHLREMLRGMYRAIQEGRVDKPGVILYLAQKREEYKKDARRKGFMSPHVPSPALKAMIDLTAFGLKHFFE